MDKAIVTPGADGSRFYGWWAVVPAVFIILLVSNGLTAGGIAAFDPSIIEQLGVSRADVKLGDAIQFGVSAILTVLTGWLADRVGVRIVMAIGAVALAASFFLLGDVTSLSEYYWVRFLMGVGLAGCGLALCVVAVSRWFVLRRGRALGLVLAGTSIGNALFPGLFTRLITAKGIDAAGDVAGWMILALLLLLAFALVEWPAVKGLRPYGASEVEASGVTAGADVAGPELSYGQILANPKFWLMGIAAFATFYSILAVNNNMILHMQGLGVRPEIGSLIAMPLFFAGLIGKLASGWLTDIYGRKPVWLISLVLMLIAAGMLVAMNATLVPFAAVIMGLGWGANYTLLQAVASDVFGTRSLGRVMGAVTVLDAGGGAIGPYITARFADASGDYQSGFLVIFVLIGLALLCASRLNVPTPDAQVRSR
ncbi:MAG: MFS transporter [Sinobacteraceae bacterium]|nr:MFS transporter [Nevskiaceae bacterium]MCP5360438.1 MFS transporter [Nevskiaceae bacterium]MCP5472081.1 MFS transporter [Nevskiaceae bacterium]